jgi:hypothetical protein
MNQDRIDRIVEELEQYLPTSAQALLQELIEGLRKAPEEPMDLITKQKILKQKIINDIYPNRTLNDAYGVEKYQTKNKLHKKDQEYYKYA